MDMFGDSDSDEDRGEVGAEILPAELTDHLNKLFTMLIKQRNRSKLTSDPSEDELAAVCDLKIAIISTHGSPLQPHSEAFAQKLNAAKFNNVHCVYDLAALSGLCDAIVCFGAGSYSLPLLPTCAVGRCLVPSGHLLIISATSAEAEAPAQENDMWILESQTDFSRIGEVTYQGSLYHQQLIRCNKQGALYWATLPDQLEREAKTAAEVTVCLCTHEREQGGLCDASHAKASAALSTHGVCIIRGLFKPERVADMAALALKDLELVKTVLLHKGIDLTKPGVEGGLYIIYTYIVIHLVDMYALIYQYSNH
jgi:hypothetical protein